MKARYIFLLAPIFLLCCKKKQNGTDSNNTTANNFAYTVQYNPVVSSAAGAKYNFSFNIKVLSGNISQNNLTCEIDGLPGVIAVSPAALTVGHLLGGNFTFDIGSLPLGDYPFRLKINSTKYGEQVHNLTLRIVPLPDYAPLLVGAYDSCYDFCNGSDFIYYPAQLSVVADTPFLLKIANIQNLGSGFVVRAWVSKSVTIPMQTVGSKIIWGTGTYNQDARPGHGGDYVLSVKDTIVSGTDTTTCTMHIEH